uniref:uncharacterized protein LOC109965147 n=1 Tax=Monopterus albus TaxID=43700 RepID=UPI0009B3A715|nr:uncharacterized protein LOC109965147 [Monopterus albus]
MHPCNDGTRSAGLGCSVWCALSITTGLSKFSAPSSLGIRWETNSVGLPFSSPSGIPIILILLHLDLPSRSKSLEQRALFSCCNCASEVSISPIRCSWSSACFSMSQTLCNRDMPQSVPKQKKKAQQYKGQKKKRKIPVGRRPFSQAGRRRSSFSGDEEQSPPPYPAQGPARPRPRTHLHQTHKSESLLRMKEETADADEFTFSQGISDQESNGSGSYYIKQEP